MMPGCTTPVRQALLCSLAVLLPLSLLPFCTVVDSWFCSDDCVLVHRAATEGMFCSWAEDTGGFLRPVTAATFLTDHAVWGLRPLGFHLTNILFHWLASCAVFLMTFMILRERGVEEAMQPAVLTGALFAVLPSHSEAVSWISGRGDVIAGALALFSLAAFMLLLRRPSLLLAAASLALYAAASLSKESALTLPLVWLAAYAGSRRAGRPRPSRTSRTVLLLSLPCLAGLAAARWMVLGTPVGGLGASRHLSILSTGTLENLARAVIRVMLPPIRPDSLATVIPAAALVLVLIWSTLGRRRAATGIGGLPLGLLAAAFLAALLPVLTLPVSVTGTDSERFLYLPGAFEVIALGSMSAVTPRRILGRTLMLLLVLVSAVSLVRVNSAWRTAGKMSRSIAVSLSGEDPSSVVVLNLPDSYRGAYVMRNGAGEAAALAAGTTAVPDFRVLCIHTVDDPAGAVSARREGERMLLELPGGWEVLRADTEPGSAGQGAGPLRFRDPGAVRVLWWNGAGMAVLD